MEQLTTSNGNPVQDDMTSQTAGDQGPILLQDFHLIDKLAHFDRERIPERVVHAKGSGAHGFFKVTHPDITKYCKADLFGKVGRETPVLVRFSTVGGEKGSADTERDPRGFAVKFYTQQGNWDMVGNNTPVFFVRDPIKFPDFIHTQKRNAQTNLKDPDAFWDFLSLVPESIHQVAILMSDRGTPDGYRNMNGYGSHTFKLINSQGQIHFCKFHFKTDQGIKNLSAEQAKLLAGTDPDYATRDLFNAIKNREFPSWTMYIQVMTVEEAQSYRWNIFDVTKVWPHKDYPLIPVGKLVLNKNPTNYFAEIEQVAFSPSHLVPGIETSVDRMLQGRLFSYPDTHRHRLGPNYTQIPVNMPKCPVANYQRDGFMTINGNGGSGPNYYPNSVSKSAQPTHKYDSKLNDFETFPLDPASKAGRFPIKFTDQDYIQAASLYSIQPKEAKNCMIQNIAAGMSGAKPFIRQRQMKHWRKVDRNLANALEKSLLRAKL